MNRTITVPALAERTRLDKFLRQELGSTWTRSAVQRAIEHGEVLVAGKRVPVHHFLKSGEIISLQLAPVAPDQLALKPNTAVMFGVIYESPDFIVVDKPSGLVVHPAPGVSEPTLADGLIARYPELVGLGTDPLRPGIVHRLDKDVSGILVVARTQPMFQHLTTAFAARQVDKQYVALVIGRLANPAGTINFPLSRQVNDRGRIAARPEAGDDTRAAITHYVVRQQFQQVALLDISIETGRTHQIRAHLAALGYPIVGDKLYRPKQLNFKSSPGRVFLHAASLSFTDLSGDRQTFSSPLPPALTDFLATLR